MPTRNINLTDHLDRFVEEQVEVGRYRNVSEVMRAGLRLLEQQTREEHGKLELLRSLASEAFEQLDQGQGIELSTERQLAAFIGRIGRRAARSAKRRSSGTWPMPRFVIAPAAECDIESILLWTHGHFGEQARLRYEALLIQAINDVANHPDFLGSSQRPEIAADVRTYHLFQSRNRVTAQAGYAKKPRHFLLYRTRADGTVEIGRVLHDSMEVERHLPDEYRPHPRSVDDVRDSEWRRNDSWESSCDYGFRAMKPARPGSRS
jgi:toxin ParE1/3/4